MHDYPVQTRVDRSETRAFSLLSYYTETEASIPLNNDRTAIHHQLSLDDEPAASSSSEYSEYSESSEVYDDVSPSLVAVSPLRIDTSKKTEIGRVGDNFPASGTTPTAGPLASAGTQYDVTSFIGSTLSSLFAPKPSRFSDRAAALTARGQEAIVLRPGPEDIAARDEESSLSDISRALPETSFPHAAFNSKMPSLQFLESSRILTDQGSEPGRRMIRLKANPRYLASATSHTERNSADSYTFRYPRPAPRPIL